MKDGPQEQRRLDFMIKCLINYGAYKEFCKADEECNRYTAVYMGVYARNWEWTKIIYNMNHIYHNILTILTIAAGIVKGVY